MVKRKYKRRRAARRRRPAKRSRKRTKRVRSFGKKVFPRSLHTKNPYGDRYDLSSLVTPSVRQRWRLNSTFDPDVTYPGHQPMGRDEMVVFFNRYLVSGVAYHLTVQNFDPDNACNVAIGWQNGADQLSGTWSTNLELPDVITRVLSPKGSAGDKTIFRGYKSCAAVTGVTREKYRVDDRYQAIATEDPAEAISMEILVQNDSLLGVGVSAVCSARLTYYTKWFDPKVISAS